MLLYCHEHSELSPGARYTIEFMLDSLGFFYQWTTRAHEGPALTYAAAAPSDKALYLPARFRLEDLHKNQLSWHSIEILGKSIPVLGLKQTGQDADRVPFDIVATIYFHLARVEECNYRHPDDVDRNVAKMHLYNVDRFRIAVVDYLLAWFAQFVEQYFERQKIFFIRKAPYPGNKKYAIAITHDVDFVTAINPIKHKLLHWMSGLGLKSKADLRRLEEQNQQVWPFNRLLDFYGRKGWRATFNFIPRLTEGLHMRYYLGSKRMKELLRQLVQKGHEVALHPSRYAFEHKGRYMREKKKLEKLSGVNVTGMRHHYLRTLFPEIWKIADKTGLSYDSTMALRRSTGFRAGTSYPFRGFDHLTQSPLKCVEFPTLFFEESLPEMGQNHTAAEAEIKQLKEEVKKLGGIYTVLWHTNLIYSVEHFGRIWNFITDLIDDKSAFLAPLNEHLDWLHFRNGVNMEMAKDNQNGFEAVFTNPGRQYSLALIMPKAVKRIWINGEEQKLQNGTVEIFAGRDQQKVIVKTEVVDDPTD